MAMDVSSGGIRNAVQDLFNLYLGTNVHSRSEAAVAIANDPAAPYSKLRKKVSASGRPLPPSNDQFCVDFLQLQSQFMDPDQVQTATEAVLAALLVQCSSHTGQLDFLLFALTALKGMAAVRWDAFVPLFLQTAATAEGAGSQNGHGSVASLSASAVTSNPSGENPNLSGRDSSAAVKEKKLVTWLRPLVCRVLLTALESDLSALTYFEMLCHMVGWINTLVSKENDASDAVGSYQYNQCKMECTAWLYYCLDVIKALIDDSRCRVPFYALLHDQTQLSIDYWPEDGALLGLFLEVHRGRDKIALHMLMLDHHLHCPTFATLRMAAFTYPSKIGEAVFGEDVAAGVQRDSLDWERALRCLRHGLRTNPSADLWRRVLLHAPRYRQQLQQQPVAARAGPISWTQPGPVFSADMTCEAVVDRIMELMQPLSLGNTLTGAGSVSMTENGRWQEWLIFADLFYFLMRSGYLDFLEFIDRLAVRFASGEQSVLRSNHVTWLLAQVFRLETVTQSLGADSKKVETTQKILSFHMAERPADQASNVTPQNMLLDFVGSSQILRLWAINRSMMEHLTGNRMPEHIQKGKAIDEWWKQVVKGERSLDYSNLDDKSMGMVWVLSHTMTQPVCDAIMSWMNSNGVKEMILPGQIGERLAIIHETHPLPITLLSGLSLHLCMRLINQIEDQIFTGPIVLSVAMLETYVRLLLVAPQTLFRHHVNGMMQKYQSGMGKAGVSLLLFELLNYRLIPLYRFHGKIKQLIFDIAKIIISVKSKRGDHRLFRLAENLCINLILSLREVTLIKKELKGAATDFTETLNRMMVVNLALTLKTRGIAEFEQIIILQPALDQILASSQHTWSEKTMRHFPPLLHDALINRTDKRMHVIQTWQQIETTVTHHCRQLLSPTTDASYVITFLNHGFPQHRQYLCAAAWVLMDGRPESINLANLGRTLKEFSPEEVTTNVYTMVDVLLHHTQLQLQHGHSQQNLLLRASACLAQFMWAQELLPFDIVLLALTDRDDDTHALRLVVGLLLDQPEFQQRVQHYCLHRGQQDHWINTGPFQRPEPQQALGNHLAGKDRYPLFFDDMCVRALPVLPLIIHRLIENEATETAERVLVAYSPLLLYHPARFSFVRDTLAYFYCHLPNKLIIRLLSTLDLSKIPFSEAFLQHVRSINSGGCPPPDYFVNLLVSLVNNIIPPIASKPRQSFAGMENSQASSRFGPIRIQATTPSSPSDVQKPFYQYQDPGSYSQLLLETAVVELLSLPPPVDKIVSMLVQIAVRVPTPLSQIQGSSTQNLANSNPKSPLLPTSPPAVADNTNASSSSPSSNLSLASSSIVSQTLSPLMIQACGLLLTQLPTAFHKFFYEETVGIIKGCWWLTDSTKSSQEVEAAFGYTVWDPMWAVQDGTSTVVGNTVALLHAFGANLPFEWLEGMHAVINLQRPIRSVAQLRLAFRIMGPLLPRLAISRPLFQKTLALLFTIMAEVFGPSSQVCSTSDISEISDLIDFLHHAVMYEVQGAGQNSGKPKLETLTLCSKAVERLHPNLQKLFIHLTINPHLSIYAATHPKFAQRSSSSPHLGTM
ncbi:hypothetical protein O6H91_17G002600 [Diphasiastrum complanatum]|uniref:Uncharacterized protein n=2 Tax=Diphasiastrum complanatum TaxID=34168 RepID=A0ACC2B3Q0_DIPCM|nr:hypothetical protein O6H91_17G002600 [Diphasiastrum complanatum]